MFCHNTKIANINRHFASVWKLISFNSFKDKAKVKKEKLKGKKKRKGTDEVRMNLCTKI